MNINASDVVDGKSAVVLGLIWTIILYFQVLVKSSLYFISLILTDQLFAHSFDAMIYWW